MQGAHSLLLRLGLALSLAATLQGCGGGGCEVSSTWACAEKADAQWKAASTAQGKCDAHQAVADCFEHCCDMTIGEFKAEEADSARLFTRLPPDSLSIGVFLNSIILNPAHPDIQKCAVKPQSQCPLKVPNQGAGAPVSLPQGAGAGETALMFGSGAEQKQALAQGQPAADAALEAAVAALEAVQTKRAAAQKAAEAAELKAEEAEAKAAKLPQTPEAVAEAKKALSLAKDLKARVATLQTKEDVAEATVAKLRDAEYEAGKRKAEAMAAIMRFAGGPEGTRTAAVKFAGGPEGKRTDGVLSAALCLSLGGTIAVSLALIVVLCLVLPRSRKVAEDEAHPMV